jgi:hypothetical protein
MELKFEYTENNHFKWGFGDDGWYNAAEAGKKFRLHLGYCTRPVESFRNECIRAAKLIAEKATKPILVGLSGGSDSQMVCLAMLEAGIPFSVIIARLRNIENDIANEHDISTAFAFCEKYNVAYQTFDIDLDNYYRTTGKDYAEYYGFTDTRVIVQCAVMDYVGKNYCYIMAGGDPLLTLYHPALTPEQDTSDIPRLVGDFIGPVWWQTPQPIMRHMMEMGYEGTSKFFLYTPELIAAYLTDEICQQFYVAQKTMYETFMIWQKTFIWRLFQMLFKPLMTTKHWPEIVQAPKFTGFEQLEKDKKRTNFYKYILREAAAGKSENTVIPILTADLIKYITTPHDHALESTYLVSAREIKLSEEFKDLLESEPVS